MLLAASDLWPVAFLAIALAWLIANIALMKLRARVRELEQENARLRSQ